VSKRKLLLADDSVTIQKVVNLTFADEGIEVISVGDGDSAMEKIRETLPDLVMLDINMPGLSGYEICENLRKSDQFKTLPVILLVGSFEPFDEDEAKRVGASDYLTKPFQSIRQLVSKVTDLLAVVRETPIFVPQTIIENNEKAQIDEIVESPAFSTLNNVPQFDQFDDTLSDELLENNSLTSDDSIVSDELIRDEILETEDILVASDTENAAQLNDVEEKSFEFVSSAADEDFIPNALSTESNTVEEKSFEFVSSTEAENEAITNYEELAFVKEQEPGTISETPHYFIEDTNNDLIDNPLEVVSHESVSAPEYSDQNNLLETFPFPEAASILELDEFNPLEIAPREEDFLVNIEEDNDFDSELTFDDSGDIYPFSNSLISEPTSLEISNMGEPDESDEIVRELFELDEGIIDEIVRRVIDKISDNVVREIAWEIVPQKADEILKHSIAERFESK
jgi:CheY-like chemotaxis protein